MEKTAFLRRVSKATAALVAFAAVSGCGYNFKGAGLTAPAGVRTIAVTVLDNRTSESGIETVFTSDLAYEFTRSKALRVVDSKEADAILSGSIASMTVDTISHTGDYESDERRVTMTLDLALKRADGSVIWSDKLETERERRVAIEAISKRLAEKVHNRILQDF